MVNKHKIAVIGLGYVGLPLAVEFGKKYPTVGFDLDYDRISQLRNGYDKTSEVQEEELSKAEVFYTTDERDIIDCNTFIVTVPTPIDRYKKPNFNPLILASKTIGKVLKKGNIVIYESTVYPGATEEICVPELENHSGLIYNRDFFCGYSPERINPGDKKRSLKNIIKLTSGSNEEVADIVNDLYKSILKTETYKVSSIAVAEAAKVIENIQRDVNIALINELSMIFNKLELDTIEVLEAAGSKWNFLPFRPGLVGGHCIGVDPYYLTYKANEIGYNPEMILAGRRINDGMGKFIADKTISKLAKAGINPIGAKVAVFGLTFKENCPDLRNTKVVNIIESLKSYNCDVVVVDPLADIEEAFDKYSIKLLDIHDIKNVDVIIFAVAHNQFKKIEQDKWKVLLKKGGLIIDIKGMVNWEKLKSKNLFYWRL